jgi:glycosyltransferase involved in cell wall biosynthesis
MSFESFVTSLQNELVEPSTTTVKLLFISTHFQQASGYAKVSHGIIRELAKLPWLEVVHFGIQSNPALSLNRPYPSNVKVYDARIHETKKEEGFGYSEIVSVMEAEKPNLVFLYNDIAVCTKYLNLIIPLKVSGKQSFQVWTYLDQVYECQPPVELESIQRDSDRFFVFSKEWRDILKRQGVTRPIDVLNHGFDPAVFKSSELTKSAARAKMNIPDDIFLFLNVNRNQPRKRHDLLVMAFVDLIVRHPSKSVFLMCVCDKGDKGGFPIFDIFTRELLLRGANPEQFKNRLLISARDMTFTDEEIGLFYRIADVGVTAADGEGFGLCTFEQMGLGVPQIVSDVVGHREYCKKDNSQIVPTALRIYMPVCLSGIGGDPHLVDPKVFADAMENYMFHDDIRFLHGENAKKTVAGYTWPKVTETLVKRLELFKAELSISD